MGLRMILAGIVNLSLGTGSLHAESNQLSAEQLMFEEIEEVVSASRQEQPLRLSSVPVSVVTAEDIHYSGLTTIGEILDFIPGVDVQQIDRNRFAVGIRGLHGSTSDKTLFLIDGRIADNPLFGGTQFNRLPLLLEDINRIEIVRGPGGAAWGASAFNGVINIITKDPEETQGVLVSGTFDEHADSYTHARWGAKAGKMIWRFSIGYQDRKSSDHAINDNNFFSRDFRTSFQFDSRMKYRFSDETKLSFGVGHSHDELGDFELTGFFPMLDGERDLTRAFTKLEHEFSNEMNGYLQWFGNFNDTNQPTTFESNSQENDIEAQLNFSLGEDHTFSIGGNFRHTRLEAIQTDPQQASLQSTPSYEQWIGLFGMDRWKANDRLILELQLRGDYYSETELDWSGRASALYTLDTEFKHTLRVSGARAFRAPLIIFREVQRTTIPIPGFPGIFGFNVLLPLEELENEGMSSFEIGYNGQLTDAINIRLDTYYQRYSDLIGAILTNVGGRIFSRFSNIDGADAFGGELQLVYTRTNGKISAWYAFNELVTDQTNQNVRSLLPAKHKAGISGRLFLPYHWTFNTNYKYSTVTQSGINRGGAGQFHRVDISFSKSVVDNRAELLFGVSDLLDQTDLEVSALGALTSHKTPGRTFFFRLQLRF